MKLKKTINLILLFCVSAAFLTWTYEALNSSPDVETEAIDLRVEILQLEDGYGYQIVKDNKTIIYQPIIPAIGEKKAFRTKEDAERVGNWVLKQIKEKKDFSITTKELLKLNISLAFVCFPLSRSVSTEGHF